MSILKLAIKVFELTDIKLRYRETVRMCEDANFKTGCDGAVGLLVSYFTSFLFIFSASLPHGQAL